MSAEMLDRFQDTCSDAGLHVGPALRELVEPGLADPHLGFVVADNIEAGIKIIERGGADSLPIASLPAALGNLSLLAAATGDRYRATTPQVLDPQSDAWQQHVDNGRNGRIVPLSREHALTRAEARGQVMRADHTLGLAGRDVQFLLSALNYGTVFNAKTMANAARTLATPPEVAASLKDLEAMPHLVVSNWALAQITQHLYEQTARQPSGALHIVDMCAGTGATSAATINRLGLAQANGHDLDSSHLSLTAIEGTPEFYQQLNEDFLVQASDQLAALGLTTKKFDNKFQPGSARIIESDVTSTIEGLDFANLGHGDVIVGLANYGIHRLPSAQDEVIIKAFAQAENAILAFGDLWENGSIVNRYFNLMNNGILNAGNVGLRERQRKHDFMTATVAQDYHPTYIDRALRTRLKSELSNDGFVSIAVKGQRAIDLIVASKIV